MPHNEKSKDASKGGSAKHAKKLSKKTKEKAGKKAKEKAAHLDEKLARKAQKAEKRKHGKDGKTAKIGKKHGSDNAKAVLDGLHCPCCKRSCPLTKPKCGKGKAVRAKRLAKAA